MDKLKLNLKDSEIKENYVEATDVANKIVKKILTK
jgi:hypothetical protein